MDKAAMMVFHERVFPQTANLNRVTGALFALLSGAIRGQTPQACPDLSPSEWDRLIETARSAQILGLLYPAVAHLKADTLPRGRLALWRKTALQTGMQEERRFRDALDVLAALAARGIRCVAFKGVVLRALYPQPGLRTMGDVDLLVPPDSLASAEEVLRERGMRPIGLKNHHQGWRTGPGSLIELHTALMKKPLPEFEQGFTMRAVSRDIGGRTLLVPAAEDAAVYQVLHMAKHFNYLGFGVRELADLTLQIEQGLDVKRLIQRLDAEGVGVFGRAILLVCAQHLQLHLPATLTADWRISEGTLLRLTHDIVQAGIHGRNNLERSLDHRISSMRHGARWRLLLWLAFPPAADLEARYDYARSHPGLLAAAWAHRLARGIVLIPGQTLRALRYSLCTLIGGYPKRRLLAELGMRAY